MGRINSPFLSFNRGEVSKKALARIDLEKMRLSAETQVNWQPTVLGPMMLRPGLEYVGGVRNDNQGRLLPFVFSNSDIALMELTANILRVWVVDGTDETLVTRVSVSTAVTSGSMTSSTGWTTSATTSGATATITGGNMTLTCTPVGGLAQAKQDIAVIAADYNKEHAIRIVVSRGPVTFRAGSTDGAEDLISTTSLDEGTHSLTCTPTGAHIYIQFESTDAYSKKVTSCTIEAAGVMTLPTPWGAFDLTSIRYDQSGDIIFLACYGIQQYKIERRATNAWSVVKFLADDGPFQSTNQPNVTMTPSVYIGNGTLTADRPYFMANHVGCLFRLFSTGQRYQTVLGASSSFSPAVRVVGTGAVARNYEWAISGTWVGTITLQRSFDGEDSGFTDVSTRTSNGNISSSTGSSAATPNLDNLIVWERVGFKAGEYTSGSATVIAGFFGGGDSGICRVTGYTSSTVVDIEVLSQFSSVVPTLDWLEGDWSAVSGWPSSNAFHDGRLFWAGRDRIWGSTSDAYNSYTVDGVGDSAPINRSVGFGPVDRINWLLPLTRLIVGREGAETSVRSSSLDEPLTPTNFSMKDCSTQGSAAITAAKIDTRGVFVQNSGRRVYELGFSAQGADYSARDLTRLNPDIGSVGFTEMAVQRQLDTQLHLVRADGQVAALLHDVDDEVEAWWRVLSDGADGEIESVCILPGSPENRVYYIVKRTIGGSTKRFIERMALREECNGLPESRCADSHVIYSGTSTATITGLSHLEGQSVVAWGWDDADTSGRDLGTYTVESGSITLSEAVENACVGLVYTAQFKSSKLAYAAAAGTALNQKKKVNRLGLVLADSHYQGLEFGQDFTTMDGLPLVEDGAETSTDTVWEEFDGPMITVPGVWDTDSRLCLQATAPRPCTVMAAVVDVTTHEAA